MENYEKKHQEDLESAKDWLAIAKENDNKLAIQILEKFFPELRESEDERIRKAQLDYWRSVGGNEWYGVPVQETIAWLENKGEQKSVEWSEEDREMLDNCLGLIQEIDSTQEEQNWLKSLKPNHWKPSEEQMKELKKECLAHSNYQLCRLLEDLKKL